MVVNFRARRINRGTLKLTRTSILIKKKQRENSTQIEDWIGISVLSPWIFFR